MRLNTPITRHEFDYDPHTTLMSVTDTQGRILYANEAFVQISGFDHEEILGQPHNLVRHPDMPQEAFADMWRTIKAGRSWTALVKNRRKNGDHYWVRANATPMVRDGQITGYMSVRTKPSRQEVEATERLYQACREGRLGRRRFHQGLIVRTGWLAGLSLLQRLSVGARIHLGIAFLCLASLIAASLQGLAAGWLGLMAGVTLLAAVLADTWLQVQITRPLRQIQQQAQTVAAGSPGPNIQLDRVDELGMLLRSVNQAGLNLRSLVDDVNMQVRGLHAAGQQIEHSSHDLSARTEQSVAGLEQTASSMEQLTAAVRQNAGTAQQASQLGQGASEAALQGGEVVSQVVETMQTISHSSSQIAEIIGVIDGIAFQTNILALNAAVEAARAGEQGRGFAVVASEVRRLAQRSALSAKEIKQLIDASVHSVRTGSALVEQAGHSMKGIVRQVRHVTQLIDEISLASQEQAQGVRQVDSAVVQLNQVTQQNASMVDVSVAAARSLTSQANRLAAAVTVYRNGLHA
ncbi:methyl-accepting chemotaxis protein [Malikia sp.]|uniref:methyl-accepting chemotaxis protein n=1 Tax=Malikia sp. TaxID=2070706 RepID=UPI002632648E|nr:methyl-accepting chemotaxis protein [Malikia sp.]MDD2728055.1 methyl-accepting chemotaxis protein [Malikia sp.]